MEIELVGLCTDICVVTNALRLRWFKPKHIFREESVAEDQTIIEEKNKGVIQMEKTLNIEGMVCMNCVKHVDNALREIKGVQDVAVSLENKLAQVQLSQDVADAALKAAIEDAGYEVIGIR